MSVLSLVPFRGSRFRLQQRVNGIYREWDRSSLITKEAYSEYFVGSPLDDNGTGRVGGIRYAMLGTLVVGSIQRSQRRRRLSCRLYLLLLYSGSFQLFGREEHHPYA
jgi:hypothetical protein